MFGVEQVLNLEQRRIAFYRQGETYDDLPVPGTIRRGLCHFTHGISTAQNAAARTLDSFGGNIVYFHTHRADSATKRTVKEGVIGAWNPGCLCRLQPLWQDTKITNWSHGYAIQLVQDDGSFLHINVPIINGRSYLVDFTARMAG